MPISTIGANGLGSGAVTNAKIDTMAATKLTGQVPDANAPSGSVIQVVSTIKTDTFSSSSTSFVDITGLSVDITPISASSRILVICNFVRGCDSAALTTFRLMRNSTPVGNGIGSGNRAPSITTTYSGNADANATYIPAGFNFLDSPATTSTLTYKVQGLQQAASTFFIGRSGRDTDLAEFGRDSSVITVMEIAG